MRFLANNQGVSRIETISIVGIVCAVVVLLGVLVWYMLSLMWRGDDANVFNTAEGLAETQATAACLVSGCTGDSETQHQHHVTEDGSIVAYYNKGANVLIADMPAGYNEGDLLTVNGEQHHVERGTMIIKATEKDGQVVCEWVQESHV